MKCSKSQKDSLDCWCGCCRSNGKDVGLELAERLGMNYAFVCEFEELRSPLRSQRDQGGGVHGNGILTRFDMEEVCFPIIVMNLLQV